MTNLSVSIETMWAWFLLALLSVRQCLTIADTIRVGGLFETEYTGQALAFQYAIEKLNLRNDILPQTLVVYDVQDVQTQDSFHASKKVCRMLKDGVAAVFGPMSSLSASHVQSVCDAMEIPHIQTRWDPNDIRDYYSLNLFPHYLTLSQAFVDLIKYWHWTDFTVLYEDNDGLLRVQELLKATEKRTMRVTVRKLEATDGEYLPILKEIKKRGASHIVIDCHVTRVHKILKQALQIQMVSQYYHYLFTTLDLSMVDMEDFKHSGANITAVRLVDPASKLVNSVMNDWILEEMRTGKSPLMKQKGLQTETALIYDAVHVFAKAMNELSNAQNIKPEPLSCSKPKTWIHGNSLLNYMKLMDFTGLSGRVKFDANGMRTEFSMDIVELSINGLEKIGTWHSETGANVTKDYNVMKAEVADALANSTLIVTAVLEAPYVVEKKNPTGPDDLYDGFAIELLKAIAISLKFNYTIRIREDGKFGSEGEDGQWNGMVRELIDKQADLAVAGMTITYDREKVIDFTKPFLYLGITILYKKPGKTPPELFSFLSPLSLEVWVYMLASYLCVSFMLFVLARFSPYEWYNPNPCNPDSDVVENQFTILNSLWFTVGSLFQQGSDIAPRALSTRLVSGIWWFFTLIMISSYTANLAAFLTVERMVSPITSASDLSRQIDIQYGSLASGSTRNFFKNSGDPIFSAMSNFMENTKPTVYVNKTREGVNRVLTGNYAYLGESTTIDYEVQRNCSLKQIGGLLDSKGYGIAMPRNSQYREIISQEILKLTEDQMIQKMYDRWWKTKSGSKCNVEGEGQKKDANELGVANVGGIFVVLLVGLALSVIIVILEFVWKARKNAREDQVRTQSICSEMAEEFRFAIRCMGSDTKPVKRRHRPDNDNGNGNGITDNGHLMPLTGYTGYSPAHGDKELYA